MLVFAPYDTVNSFVKTTISILTDLFRKHGYNVAVDLSLHSTMSAYFEIPQESIVPVSEEVYCEKDLENMKRHSVPYVNTESNLVKDNFEMLNSKNAVIDVWPEGIPQQNSFWVPEELVQKNANFIRNQLVFKRKYQQYVDKVLRKVSKCDQSEKESIFIGLHVRRTDYEDFSRNKLKKVCMNRNIKK